MDLALVFGQLCRCCCHFLVKTFKKTGEAETIFFQTTNKAHYLVVKITEHLKCFAVNIMDTVTYGSKFTAQTKTLCKKTFCGLCHLSL